MSSDPAITLRALHRFGLGPRPGDLAQIGSGARDLFREEVRSRQIATLTGLPYMTAAEIGPALRDFQQDERMRRETRATPEQPAPGNANAAMAAPTPSGVPPATAAAPRQQVTPPFPQHVFREEARAEFLAKLEPLGGIGERLVSFWANHFAVSVNRVRACGSSRGAWCVRPYAPMFRTVCRYASGGGNPPRDDPLSRQSAIDRPNSRAGTRRGRGLNENLAREVLELHTLGVAGGYTQADVTSLAKIITGWSLNPPNATDGPPGAFRFNPNLHEPGDHALLGKTYVEAGFHQGKLALEDLARHPSTAQHIARKLTRHFVADEPPASMVARLARVFRDTEGDLQQVSLAVIESPECWSAAATKMRTPRDFLVAASRALGRKPDFGQILGPLGAMGQQMWTPGGPERLSRHRGGMGLSPRGSRPGSMLRRRSHARAPLRWSQPR